MNLGRRIKGRTVRFWLQRSFGSRVSNFLPRCGRLGTWIVLASLILAGCASRVIRHDTDSEDVPHVTWELRSGPGSGDVNCTSTKRDVPCMMQASTMVAPRLATFTLDLHGGAQRVGYLGTYQVSFFGSPPHRHEVQEEVEPGKNVKVIVLVDSVTTKPGNYSVEVEVRASMGAASYPFKFIIPVTVR